MILFSDRAFEQLMALKMEKFFHFRKTFHTKQTARYGIIGSFDELILNQRQAHGRKIQGKVKAQFDAFPVEPGYAVLIYAVPYLDIHPAFPQPIELPQPDLPMIELPEPNLPQPVLLPAHDAVLPQPIPPVG